MHEGQHEVAVELTKRSDYWKLLQKKAGIIQVNAFQAFEIIRSAENFTVEVRTIAGIIIVGPNTTVKLLILQWKARRLGVLAEITFEARKITRSVAD